jgi:hypothetical protein
MYPKKRSRTSAISQKCTACKGGDVAQIRSCVKTDCALYQHRNGNSGVSPMLLGDAIKQKCLQCKGGDVKQAKACTDVTCPLFAFSWADILRPNFAPPPMPIGGFKNNRF